MFFTVGTVSRDTLQMIIVAVSINDRQGTNDANLNSDLQDILHWGQQHQVGVHFAGISASNRLVAQEHSQVAHINELISDIFEESYVDALPADQIQSLEICGSMSFVQILLELILELIAALATVSALSLPLIPTWLGIQHKTMDLPLSVSSV